MKERVHISIDASDDFWLLPPWPTACELAKALPSHSWTLVGGLMVALHARIAELPTARSTVDVDATLHLETQAVTFAQVAATLEMLGYTLDLNTRFAYKFERDRERIDVMCADRYKVSKIPKYRGRELFGIPGGTRALRETWNVDLEMPEQTFEFVIPSVRGALVLKGAAYLEDSRDRERHLEDAVLLFACLTAEDLNLENLSSQSRRRIRALAQALAEKTSPWIAHSAAAQSLAREAIESLE